MDEKLENPQQNGLPADDMIQPEESTEIQIDTRQPEPGRRNKIHKIKLHELTLKALFDAYYD